MECTLPKSSALQFKIRSRKPHCAKGESWMSTYASDGVHVFRIDCTGELLFPKLTVWPMSVSNCSYGLELPESGVDVTELCGAACVGHLYVGFSNGTVARYVVGTSKPELQVSVSLFNGIIGFSSVFFSKGLLACIDSLGGVTLMDFPTKLLKVQPNYLLCFSKTHTIKYSLLDDNFVIQYIDRKSDECVYTETWDIISRSFKSSDNDVIPIQKDPISIVRESLIFYDEDTLLVPLINNYSDISLVDMIRNVLSSTYLFELEFGNVSPAKNLRPSLLVRALLDSKWEPPPLSLIQTILTRIVSPKHSVSLDHIALSELISLIDIKLEIEGDFNARFFQSVCLELVRQKIIHSGGASDLADTIMVKSIISTLKGLENVELEKNSIIFFWAFYLFQYFGGKSVLFNDLFFKFYQYKSDPIGLGNLILLGTRHSMKFFKRLAAIIKESNDCKFPLFLIRRLMETNVQHSLRVLPMIMELVVLPCLDPMNLKLRKNSIDSTTKVFKLMNKLYPMTSFHQGKQKFAIGTTQGVITVYDLRTAAKWRSLEGHTGAISAVGFEGASGKHLCSYSATDSTVRVWQLGHGGGLVINASHPVGNSFVASLSGLIGASNGKCLQVKQLGPVDEYPDALSHPFNLSYRIHGVKIRWTSSTDILLIRENGAGVQVKL